LALALDHEFAYVDLPVVALQLTHGTTAIETEAILDTGADVSVFDATIAEILGIATANTRRVIDIGGTLHRVAYARVNLVVLGPRGELPVPELAVGFLPGLGKAFGNLLGRDFFERLDFGLHHDALPTRRRFYLGKP
jgi:hypothetical protein